jgi:very-short-patch-repair endonuclease
MAVKAIRGLGEVPKLGKVPGLGQGKRGPSTIPTGKTALRPRPLGISSQMSTQARLENMAMQGVVGSLPERIVWRWLEDERLLYQAQKAEMGGRTVIGGAVVDFIVYGFMGKPVILRVQGGYWHGPAFSDRSTSDDEQAGRLRSLGYHVVDLWEQDIYDAALNNRLGDFIRLAIVS